MFSLILQLIRLISFITACKALLINVGKAQYKLLDYYLSIINGPLAQSDYGANNAKVVFSRLIRTRLHFLFGLCSLYK